MRGSFFLFQRFPPSFQTASSASPLRAHNLPFLNLLHILSFPFLHFLYPPTQSPIFLIHTLPTPNLGLGPVANDQWSGQGMHDECWATRVLPMRMRGSVRRDKRTPAYYSCSSTNTGRRAFTPSHCSANCLSCIGSTRSRTHAETCASPVPAGSFLYQLPNDTNRSGLARLGRLWCGFGWRLPRPQITVAAVFTAGVSCLFSRLFPLPPLVFFFCSYSLRTPFPFIIAALAPESDSVTFLQVSLHDVHSPSFPFPRLHYSLLRILSRRPP